jgi:cytochrome c oxidase assembly protein subunit 15
VLTCLIFTLGFVLKSRAGSTGTHYKLLFVAVYLQVLLGIIVRYSQATLACSDFPLCNGALVPAFDNYQIALHFVHRLGALAIFAIAASLFYRALRDKSDVKGFAFAFALVLTQAFFGIMIVKTSMFLPVIILHGATGFGLLGFLAFKSFSSIFTSVGVNSEIRSVA